MLIFSDRFTPEMALTILQSTDQFVGALDLQGHLIYANQTALSFIDSQWSDVAGQLFWDTPWWNFDAQLREKLKNIISTVAQTLMPQGLQVVHRSADGNDYSFYFTLKPLFDKSQQHIGFIAEGKDVNDLVLEQDRTSRESRRYRDLFTNSADAHLIIENSVFTKVNQVAVAALGYDSEDELIHIHPFEISPDLQRDGQKSREKAEEMIALAYKNGSHRFEWIHLRKDNTPIDVEVVLTPIVSGSKKLLYVTWRDIGERILVQKALVEKHLALSNLLIGISHELNTPLGNALMTTSFLCRTIEELSANDIDNEVLTTLLEAVSATERNIEHTVSLLDFFKNHALGNRTAEDTIKPIHSITKQALEQKSDI